MDNDRGVSRFLTLERMALSGSHQPRHGSGDLLGGMFTTDLPAELHWVRMLSATVILRGEPNHGSGIGLGRGAPSRRSVRAVSGSTTTEGSGRERRAGAR